MFAKLSAEWFSWSCKYQFWWLLRISYFKFIHLFNKPSIIGQIQSRTAFNYHILWHTIWDMLDVLIMVRLNCILLVVIKRICCVQWQMRKNDHHVASINSKPTRNVYWMADAIRFLLSFNSVHITPHYVYVFILNKKHTPWIDIFTYDGLYNRLLCMLGTLLTPFASYANNICMRVRWSHKITITNLMSCQYKFDADIMKSWCRRKRSSYLYIFIISCVSFCCSNDGFQPGIIFNIFKISIHIYEWYGPNELRPSYLNLIEEKSIISLLRFSFHWLYITQFHSRQKIQ